MDNRRLASKVAIVTGSGRGIGRSEAMTLAREGAKVVVSDFGTNAEGQSSARPSPRRSGKPAGEAVPVSEDLMKPGGPQRIVEAAVDAFGGLDILVNNAGLRAGNPIHKLTEEQWDTVLDSHLKASFLTIKHAIPLLRQRGGGSIINTGSEAGLGMPFNSAYTAAKEGLAGLTRSVAREQGRFGIRCNLIRPRATAGQTGGGDWFAKNLAGTWKPLLTALGPLLDRRARSRRLGQARAAGFDRRVRHLAVHAGRKERQWPRFLRRRRRSCHALSARVRLHAVPRRRLERRFARPVRAHDDGQADRSVPVPESRSPTTD
jgi:NAD(P)-dependent dehydrogenase (short-subunit alcohol dehydrogenase family)